MASLQTSSMAHANNGNAVKDRRVRERAQQVNGFAAALGILADWLKHSVMRCILVPPILLCMAQYPASANDDLVAHDNRLPAYLIRLPESVTSVFVAETLAAQFHRFDNVAGAPIEYRGASYMSIGKSGDRKRQNGDRRTPLGIYFVTEQLDTSRMHEKYGITAFVLDYPNVLDRRAKRSGDGIWVHGVDPRAGERPPRDTDGCIALPNESLAMLESRFAANTTPVIVTRRVNWIDRGALLELDRDLERAVSRWATGLQQDLYAYLSSYDDDFRHWGMNKQEWVAFRAAALESRPVQKVTVSELLLLAEPAEPGTYLSRFRLAISEGANTVSVTKRLYWRRTALGDLAIIAEDSG